MRKLKARTMSLYKVSLLIVFLTAAYVDGDSLISKGRKYYFNSCQCGKAVALGYGVFSLNSLNTKFSYSHAKKIVNK